MLLQQERFLCTCQRPWRAASGTGPIWGGDLGALRSALCRARIWRRKNRLKATVFPINCSRMKLSEFQCIVLSSLVPLLSIEQNFATAGRASWRLFSLGASTAGFDEDDHSQESELTSQGDADVTKSEKQRQYGNLRAAGIISGVTVLGTLAAVSFTLASGGPSALAEAISKSGFFAAFALIFVSEIGDKTFFIAALLAMRHSRGLVLLGSMGALSLMTIISVVIGRLFQRVPAQLQTTLPVGEYAAVALLILFGLKAIKEAWELPSSPAKDDVSESGEFAEAEEVVKQAQVEKKLSTPMKILGETFSLVFLAEWGDRSMLATVALGAAQSPWGVASGAIVAHTLATLLAVLGGAFLAQYISEKLVGYTGGVLFLAFAAATLLGAF